jgi:hypothetical protein
VNELKFGITFEKRIFFSKVFPVKERVKIKVVNFLTYNFPFRLFVFKFDIYFLIVLTLSNVFILGEFSITLE